ncbi:serine-rich coiled-coil domain-containing protein 2 isoform X1 [Fundulus heteroclitus]|uniref:serine-rich coiled-coil domain-containing protein 2 isoform X1 n=1 Tax=Fundulus heteroclitus TaxID=8078 RepID=UPI00165C8124|nr:serine-rich coiled-coil domain-containing protein 2 isoform X1 [Fundulus heteroclitus]XP_021172875.2 serine-rich coiled-coil domain-containing protein 2 isoform X1 [Fundulus heteroclitus]XP_035982711.1 serine-rich coiled-coil domain-containing protein 2 isoform X1 [Fundulus heteroclitus]
MEEKAFLGPAMVSRLPKFGGRPSACGNSPGCNGSTETPTSMQHGKTSSSGTRPNGLIRPSPSCIKWKKDDSMTSSSPSIPAIPGDGNEEKAQHHAPSLPEVKNSSLSTPKMRRSGVLMVAASSPKTVPKQLTKISPKTAKVGQNHLNGLSKIAYSTSGIPGRTGSESRLVRPMLGIASPRSISQDSLSPSIEHQKILTLDHMVRSNSFTHFKQIPSPTCEPMTRSFSFNRAVELAKPLANTQLRPPRSSFLKPPRVSNGRLCLGLNGKLGGAGSGFHYSKSLPADSSLPNPSFPAVATPPRVLRKPLLSSSGLTKPLANSVGSLGHRSAPAAQKQQKSPLSDGLKEGIRSSVSSDCDGPLRISKGAESAGEGGKADSSSDSGGSSGTGNGPERDVHDQSSVQMATETPEDMSLSSVSSLERGDISEEFLDDFDYAGDVFSDGDMPGSTTQTLLQRFPSENTDWEPAELTGNKEETPMQEMQESTQESLVLSPVQSDAPQGSSVELSPSNSSGGTYMWDEEGLEPLGEPKSPLESYEDSEINSMDILNNLGPLGTGDLDDNDLMLDVDLPEDGLLDFDNMSLMERPDRGGRQAQRRKQHRWSGPDHFFHDSRLHFFNNYDCHKTPRFPSRPVQSEGKQPGFRPMLDELTLEHMTQDCSVLRNQLLGLKTLLQLEETGSPADVCEQTEDNAAAPQIEALVKEVQVLREELRSRDKTIALLTVQCQQLQRHHQQREQMPHEGRQVRCQCRHQEDPSSLQRDEKRTDKRMQHHDKATQTNWRTQSHPPRMLQPFNPYLNEQPHQERLIKTPPTEGHSELTWSRSEEATCIDNDRPLEAAKVDVSGAAGSDKLSHLPRTNLRSLRSRAPQGISGRDGRASAPQSASQFGRRAPAVTAQNSDAPRLARSARPRMLQSPRIHKLMSLPASDSGGAGGFASLESGRFSGPPASQTKQLPPPTRGLPCFNAEPQVQAPKLCQTSLLRPLRTSEPR